MMTFKQFFFIGMAMCLSLASAHTLLELRFIGEQQMATGRTFEGTVVGGISGIDYDAASDRYIAISDDRSQHNPARFYEISFDITSEGFLGGQFWQVTTLQDAEGNAFAEGSVDPESIRVLGDSLFWSSEGQNNANGTIDPFVWEIKRDGSFVRAFNVPHRYMPMAGVPIGVRNNLAFESLSLEPTGTTLYTATEGPLLQDGAVPTLLSAGLIRFTAYDVASGDASAEYVYVIDALPFAPEPLDAFKTVGITEILALGEMQFLVLERTYAAGVGNGARIYLADATRASDVLDVATLRGANDIVPMQKSLVLDLADLGIPLDNLEAMTFGPNFENGNRLLVLASDNNFNDKQFTQFLAFEVIER